MSTGELVLADEEEAVVSGELILFRGEHPDFLDLVEELLKWAQSDESEGHPLKPSSWFIALLNEWVDEDRRILAMALIKRGKGKHVSGD